MTKRRFLSMFLVALLFVTITLSGCTVGNAPTLTQALGDQDVTLNAGGSTYNISVAGQLANWQGHGVSVWVYIVTTDPCTSTTTYVKPAASYSIVVTCQNNKWNITGKTNADGSIASAKASKR